MKETMPHTNPAYDREMNKMSQLLSDMETALHEQLTDLESAFADMDSERAREIRQKDSRLNEMEGRALRQSIAVLACYQPVAEDLRTVVGSLYAAAEYERMGDYVKNFAQSIELFATHRETLKIFPMLLKMTRDVRAQFEEYIAARDRDDLSAAHKVWERDEEIDRAFRATVNEAADNQSAGDGNAHSLILAISIASNLERLGDRVKNLVEIFHYRKTGQRLEEEKKED